MNRMSQDHFNLWISEERVPEKVNALVLSLSGEIDKDPGKRWKVIRGIINKLSRRGYFSTHIPINFRQKFLGDIIILSTNKINENEVMRNLPRIEGAILRTSYGDEIHLNEFPTIFEGAWQDWFREVMQKRGFLHQGLGTYVATDQLAESTTHKKAFRITTELVDGRPSLWIDPETRVMIPLSYEEAVAATEDEPLPVRVLMDWRFAFVVGVYDENVSQYKNIGLEEYWRERGIPVKPTHRVFKVKFADQITAYAYPEVCVFKEYQRGKKQLGGKKYKPSERIELVQKLLKEKLARIDFLGNPLSFSTMPANIVGAEHNKMEFGTGHDFQVLLKHGASISSVNILNVKNSFVKGAEPYTGKQSGSYLVICPQELEKKIGLALRKIELAYQSLNMGSINQLLPTSFVKGTKLTDYQEAFNLMIEEMLSRSQDTQHVIAFVVLPNVSWENSIYYEAKQIFFNPSRILEDIKPIQIQCLESSTIDKIIANMQFIIENIVPQIYLKLYGRHAALWLCEVPADSNIYPENLGITAYACFDVSRRRKLKSQVSVFTAVTDGYGRFISFDSIPSGGERLTELSFYNLIERIASMCKAYSIQFNKREPNLKFNLQRIVLYKDGRIDPKEGDLMLKVFNNGVPDEGREPIPELFAKRRDLPQSLAIDIVSVNKSANRRIFSKQGEDWSNPRRGSYYGKNGEKSCLLISSQVHKVNNVETMTVKPLQLELVHHFNINSDLPTPDIRSMAHEYYHLTFLDWVTFYQRSKFALPQRITQKTGEFLSAQVYVPKEVIVL